MADAVAPARFDHARRSTQPEWLDNADLGEAELAPYLRSLAAINRATLGHWPIIGWLRRATSDASREPLILLDVGCGNGDLLRVLSRWSRRHRPGLRFIGIDRDPHTIDVARAATGDAEPIEYIVADVFDYRPARRIDFVTGSLVTHHLPDHLIVGLLHFMESTAQRGWINCDLQRHVIPHGFIGAVGALTRLHPLVVHDGRISVARSLTRAEWERLIARTTIPRGALRLRWFLFRLVLSRLHGVAAGEGVNARFTNYNT
ncbi:MAG: methyltransferase domain-containing protein [Xanthobacteraceae bacterium]|nr:MAG: methyltransferase domain-containing protein [Xanthobacteraceae bacterium]